MKTFSAARKALTVFALGCFLIILSVVMFKVGDHVSHREVVTYVNGLKVIDNSSRGTSYMVAGSYLLLSGMVLSLGGGVWYIIVKAKTGKQGS